MTAIPESPADITAAWCNEVLDLGRVADVRVEDLGAGLGLLGEVVRLHLAYDGPPGPRTLIVKLQSPAAENRFLGQVMGFYDREVSFYREVAASVGVRVPACHHAAIDPQGAPFVLVLEEITGARTLDQVVGATRADSEAVIDVAVELHARYWDSDEVRALRWLPAINDPLFLAASDLAQQKLPAYLEHWKGKVPDATLDFVVALTPHYPALLQWWVDQGQLTFAHMDFRADNFLFGGSAGDGVVTLLDWQLSLRGAGVWDVANFLAASITTEDRRSWEEDLVDRYHAGLQAAGVVGYGRDRCWRDYRYAIAQQAWSTCPMGDVHPGNERGQLLLDTVTPRYLRAADDLDVYEVLDLFGQPRRSP
ncbi:MAG TPA: phosphotransferase [Acidimicrobiales bacterium]|nr:phosphotransferase [Acidimicrobiales bacterium]